ncbi:MAG: putative Zn-dependent protease, partial [Myxococcota bacterium]
MSALRWLLGLLLLSPPALADSVEDAEVLLRAERPGAAMRLLQDHLSADGDDDVAAHELLIDIQLNGGLVDTVREVYLQRARDQPGDADTWYLFGRATMSPGESDRAYEQAIALQPGHARALTGRAALQRALNQPAAAIPLYVEALSQDSSLL